MDNEQVELTSNNLLEAMEKNMHTLDQHTYILSEGVKKCKANTKGAAGEQLLLMSDAIIACMQAQNVIAATMGGMIAATMGDPSEADEK